MSAARIILVTGLSGAGKGTILDMLEDLGFEAVDNPPLALLDALVERGDARLAIGIDARTDGFAAEDVLAARDRLRDAAGRKVDLVYATADDDMLLRRFSATRRLHPLAREGRVAEAITAERLLTAKLRDAADHLIDTTKLPVPDLRRMVEERIAPGPRAALTFTLVSFAFASGLPADADMIFDARFLQNPHYDPILQPLTGLDPRVVRFVQEDADYAPFTQGIMSLLDLVLPRFVGEGKKYATVGVGCTGGRHRSVTIVEDLAARLAARAAGRPGGEACTQGSSGDACSQGMTHASSAAPSLSWSKVIITVLHRELGDRPRLFVPHGEPELT